VQHEIVEAARRLDARHLTDRDGHDRADVVERRLLAHGTEGRDGEVLHLHFFFSLGAAKVPGFRPGESLDAVRR
jgi:hypothetical protein